MSLDGWFRFSVFPFKRVPLTVTYISMGARFFLIYNSRYILHNHASDNHH